MRISIPEPAAPVRSCTHNLEPGLPMTPLAREYNCLPPGPTRAAFRKEHSNLTLQPLAKWSEDERRYGLGVDPQASNTIGSGLLNDILIDATISLVWNKLAPLRYACTPFEHPDPEAPRRSVDITKATAASTVLTNAQDLEVGDGTLSEVNVAMDQYSISWQMRNDDLQKGLNLERLAEVNARAFANAIVDVFAANLTVANLGAGITVGAAGSFGTHLLPPLLVTGKNWDAVNLMIDASYLAPLLPTQTTSIRTAAPGAFGFNRIVEQNRWSAAAEHTVGLLADPGAFTMVHALPVTPPGAVLLTRKTSYLEALDLTIATHTWFSLKTRTFWASYDVLLGFTVADANRAELLVSE